MVSPVPVGESQWEDVLASQRNSGASSDSWLRKALLLVAEPVATYPILSKEKQEQTTEAWSNIIAIEPIVCDRIP